MSWDEDYWRDEEAEEVNKRQKARELGVPKEKVDELLRGKDAFSVTDEDIERLLGEE